MTGTTNAPPEAAVELIPAVPLTLEGASVLHQMMRFRWTAWRALTPESRAGVLHEAVTALGAMERPSEHSHSGVYSLLGHKGDLLFLHFRRSFISPLFQAFFIGQLGVDDYILGAV